MKNLKKIALIIGMVLITSFILMMIGDKIKANVDKTKPSKRNYNIGLHKIANV